MRLPRNFINVLNRVIEKNKEKLFIFAEDSVSFEMWLTTELYVELWLADFYVEMSPRNHNKIHDLKFEKNGKANVFEIKIQNPNSQTKVIRQSQDDVKKLLRSDVDGNKYFLFFSVRPYELEAKKNKK